MNNSGPRSKSISPGLVPGLFLCLRENIMYSVIQKLLFTQDAEWSHDFSINWLKTYPKQFIGLRL